MDQGFPSDESGPASPHLATDPDRAPARLAEPIALAVEILARTWAIYRARLAVCWAVYWGEAFANWSILLVSALVLFGMEAAFKEPALAEFSQFLIFLARIIVPIWLQIGLNLALLKIVRDRPVALEDLFRGGPFLLATLLATIAVLAVALVPPLAAYLAIDGFLSRLTAFSHALATLVLLSVARSPRPARGRCWSGSPARG
jgi:hypothetical protein